MWGSSTARGSGEQAWVDRRFLFVDVDAGSEEAARLESGTESLLVYDRSPGGVDEDSGRLHERQPAGVDEVARLGRERHVDADHVGL